jgi:hypothetical protein
MPNVSLIDKLEPNCKPKGRKTGRLLPQSCQALRKLHWKNTQHWDSLLPENAKITAQLALSDFTQNKIKSL